MKTLTEQESTEPANNCREATFLIEKQQSDVLTVREQQVLELHLKDCIYCTLFLQQSLVITKLVKQVLAAPQTKQTLDKGFKEQLQQRIDTYLNKPSADE